MCINVSIKILFHIEALTTYFAIEPVLTGVDRQVIPVLLFVHERLGAILAVIPQPFMTPHVTFIMGLKSKSPSTNPAIKLKLSRVNLHVLT